MKSTMKWSVLYPEDKKQSRAAVRVFCVDRLDASNMLSASDGGKLERVRVYS